jgi:UDP-N-acetylmuramoyl-L-alanyl-D-glutamate--2,6-diaminopimelate ligase
MPADQSSRSRPSSSVRNRGGLPLSLLLRRLKETGVLDGTRTGTSSVDDIRISHLEDDSRMVRSGGLFVAIRGASADGHAFIDKAIENGAHAVVCETVPTEVQRRFPSTVFVRVSDSRRAVGDLAAAFYGDPSEQLTMVGITGTNGKTTTAFLVHHLLTALDVKAGLLSTVEVRIGTETTDAQLTTPGALELQRTLRGMVDSGCTACAMEVSSHALEQERTRGTRYDVAVFTNLTADHLDYHGTKTAYRAAKKRLFDGLSAEATAVVNADDADAPQMIADTDASVRTYGLAGRADDRALDGPLDVPVEVLDHGLDGLRLRLDGAERSFRLVGRFNAYNLAAAQGVGRALGYDADAARDALAEAPPVPGRFEQLRFADGTTVIVDYAHTPDALENVLAAIRDVMPQGAALWCVFGCGGDRDPTKRRVMGSIAEQRADRVIVTSDNPRTEEPEAIMNDIRRGMSQPGEARWIVDREAAIETAATEAAPGDVVLIAGKGHETYQVVGTDRRPFDDRDVARTYFRHRTANR